MHAVFIRAPVSSSERRGPGGCTAGTGESIGPRRRMAERPVVCRQGRVTVAAFHPELAGDLRLHELLLSDIEGD